jgi:hypothetical protein
VGGEARGRDKKEEKKRKKKRKKREKEKRKGNKKEMFYLFLEIAIHTFYFAYYYNIMKNRI